VDFSKRAPNALYQFNADDNEADYQSRCTTLIQELDSSVAKVTNPDDKEVGSLKAVDRNLETFAL
jgi:hypothetical protein